MGTRSITLFIDQPFEQKGKMIKPKIAQMYRQYDGYPMGHGRELASFLVKHVMVDGFGDPNAKAFNGMGCLAAQVVAHFKKGVGGFYLEDPKIKDCGQEYTYTLTNNGAGKEVTFSCYKVWNKKMLYVGTPSGFLEYLKPQIIEKRKERRERMKSVK